MPIFAPDTSGLAQGISTAGGALAQALEKRAENRLLREEKQEKQKEYGSLLDSLINQGGQLGGAAQALKESGAGHQIGMPIVNEAFKQSFNNLGASNTPQARETYKTNQQLIKGISHDANIARRLLSESDAIEKAINSKGIPGKGPIGSIWEHGQEFFNAVPKEVQLLKTLKKRSMLELGDTKGIKLTDLKLKYLDDSLWDPRKSVEENREAFRVWKDVLNDYISYEEKLNKTLSSNKNAMLDPSLSIRISELDNQNKSELDNQNKSESNNVKLYDKPPNAKEHKGEFMRNERGERVQSNGKRWVKVKGT